MIEVHPNPEQALSDGAQSLTPVNFAELMTEARSLAESIGRPLADALGVQIFPPPELDMTATDLALTIGGGVDVRLWKGLAVGGDVRYLRLFDDTEGFDFAFVTSRISYRF